jgi:hypothetical protein
MLWWSHLSALGGLNVTALLAVAIAAWLVGARCWRLALAWCLLFGAALLVAAASQMAFLGWGIGVRALSFTGFSGHAATRAAAVFPGRLYLLLERRGAARGAGVRRGGSCRRRVLARCWRSRWRASRSAPIPPAKPWPAALLGLARPRCSSPAPAPRATARRSLCCWACWRRPCCCRAPIPRQFPPVADGGRAQAVRRDRVWLRNGWQPAQGPYVPNLAEKQATDGMMPPLSIPE